MAESKARDLQVEEEFLSFGNGKKSHMIGHGIGLECSEQPIVSRNEPSKIEEGYVMAIEIHLTKQGVGVLKLEDVVQVKRERNVFLTKSPRILHEID